MRATVDLVVTTTGACLNRRKKNALRAIDLYAGVGGWSLGLRMAGVDVVASYEIWPAAITTNRANNEHDANCVDIRNFDLNSLPRDIDIVVGSPPCTQFSFSNRGGGGDIDDGLIDIRRFFEVVERLRPRWFVMENVPRVASIVERELGPGGTLRRYSKLGAKTMQINMVDFGLPQRRQRCLIGNLDFDLLQTYAIEQSPTLGEVVAALSKSQVVDPLYGLTLPKRKLSDHEQEEPLGNEERRINRAAKSEHTIYNAMPFPDRMDRPVRTITATCTRVSRESVIIPVENKRAVRRLTLRERSTLQGFPISFQFFGTSYSQKMRMIGNAVPPLMSFYVGCAMRGLARSKLPSLENAFSAFEGPTLQPPKTPPDRKSNRYPASRTFRFAIPSLRMKSGVRFELGNDYKALRTDWRIQFVFGNSKSIHELALRAAISRSALKGLPQRTVKAVQPLLDGLRTSMSEMDLQGLQAAWCHTDPGRTHPFDLLDLLDSTSRSLTSTLEKCEPEARRAIIRILNSEFSHTTPLVGVQKVLQHSPRVLAGILVGALANDTLARVRSSAATRPVSGSKR